MWCFQGKTSTKVWFEYATQVTPPKKYTHKKKKNHTPNPNTYNINLTLLPVDGGDMFLSQDPPRGPEVFFSSINP